MSESKTPELSRHAAEEFATKWKDTKEEKQYAESFWNDFFRNLCGVDDLQVAGVEFQKPVKNSVSGNINYLDVYWKGVALIEHKSAGESLDKAEIQARGYWRSLPPGYRPKTIIISDFLNFRLIDVALNRSHEFPLSKLPENIHRFEAIISGNRTRVSEEEITVDQQAAKLMANLYLELESHGFEGHETSIFLVRILFLLFGDDTGMWEKNLFLKLVLETNENGSDVGRFLDTLFGVLNQPETQRINDLNISLKKFPYVNGGIFAEKISVIDFNKKMRVALVEAANYDWTTINPTIFGSLFQLIKTKEARHALGEHYTSEENINKIVYPLFLDELHERLAKSWDSVKELKKLRQDLGKIKIFDPACGCGNFLVVSYRHLRQLELELLVRLNNLEDKGHALQLDGSMGLSITLSQLYGIEVEEWPAQVAKVALFLTDHQENLKLERVTGLAPNRFPIQDSATIYNISALSDDWQKLVPVSDSTFVLGNPPFLGSLMLSDDQKVEQKQVWRNNPKSGIIDFVANWYLLAARYIQGTAARVAFVSTNSIVQGEQTAILWNELHQYGIEIDFAHQTFAWENSSAGKAAVHCVIIGFSSGKKSKSRFLWTYDNVSGEPILHSAKHINAYLVDAPGVIIGTRQSPLGAGLPPMTYGSMPRDDGQLSKLSAAQAEDMSCLTASRDIVCGW
jgi:type I restriction-modification system DNA methylase subunit